MWSSHCWQNFNIKREQCHIMFFKRIVENLQALIKTWQLSFYCPWWHDLLCLCLTHAISRFCIHLFQFAVKTFWKCSFKPETFLHLKRGNDSFRKGLGKAALLCWFYLWICVHALHLKKNSGEAEWTCSNFHQIVVFQT